MKKLTIALVCMAVIGCAIPIASAGPLADYGDAPDPTYPSLFASQCPYHLNVIEEWIGQSPASTTTVETDALVLDMDSDDGAVAFGRRYIQSSATNIGYVEVPISVAIDSSEGIRYLNIVADLNNDGMWANYIFDLGTGTQTQREWMVQNMMLPLEPGIQENFIMFYPFPDTSVDTSSGVWVRFTLSTEPINKSIFGDAGWDGSGPPGGFLRGETEDWNLAPVPHDFQVYPPGDKGEPPSLLSSEPSLLSSEPSLLSSEPVGGYLRGGVPDIAQKINECAPTSAANSLIWLADKHSFSGKLPDQTTLIEELKTDMKWDDGIWTKDFLPGKKNITLRRNLPIVNKGQSNPSWDWYKEELQRGEDVEIRIGLTKDAKKWGHWMTLVGYMFDGKDRWLIFHDPDDNKTGNARYKLDGQKLVDYGNNATITYGVSESHIRKEVPSLTPLGLTALIGSLSIIAVLTIRGRRK